MGKMSNLMITIDQEVEWTFGDWPEGHGVGSSDMSGVARRVAEQCGLPYDIVQPMVFARISAVLREQDERRASA